MKKIDGEPDRPSCGSCRFARKHPHQVGLLECCFKPPTPLPIQQGGVFGVTALRAPVEPTDFCASFSVQAIEVK